MTQIGPLVSLASVTLLPLVTYAGVCDSVDVLSGTAIVYNIDGCAAAPFAAPCVSSSRSTVTRYPDAEAVPADLLGGTITGDTSGASLSLSGWDYLCETTSFGTTSYHYKRGSVQCFIFTTWPVYPEMLRIRITPAGPVFSVDYYTNDDAGEDPRFTVLETVTLTN